MHDIFVLQDEVARSVASTVSGRVELADRERAVRLSPNALRAYDLILRAKALPPEIHSRRQPQALACAERAVVLDPTSARAHARAAWCLFFNYMACWTADRTNTLARAYEFARRAVVLDESDSLAHVYIRDNSPVPTGVSTKRDRKSTNAIDLNPNDADARRYYGLFLAATGNPDAGIEQIDLSKRLNPFDTRGAWVKGIACFTARRYDEAIVALQAGSRSPQ